MHASEMTGVGLGPVFQFEWKRTARRWQIYATRSFFVLILLIALVIVWSSLDGPLLRVNALSVMNRQARIGELFFTAIVGTQLALIMLAAPAYTAGSISLEKARGSLAHLLVTDLSDAEIILGKLGSRLIPVIGLCLCSLPVLFESLLLGGIDPEGLIASYLITLGLGVASCALALTLSIWCKKTHEALLATYLFLSIFLLSSYMWRVAVWAGYIDIGPPGWLELANPFQLAFLPYSRGGESNLMPSCWFVLGALAFTVVLMTVAIYRLRAVTLRQMNQPARRPKRLWRLLNPANWLRWIPGPPLDLNPVLWREWHRNRPTGWTQVLWFVYAGAGVVFVGTAIYMRFSDKPMAQGMAAWINGMLVAVGLLLVSVSSVSSLAEERVRGSLDVLMTTPLSTPGIVFGKWLGSFRSIPLLAFLPTLLGTVLAMSTGRWFWVLAMVFLIVAQGAAVTSMGLATATWVARFGRAVAICVSAYVIMTVGWLFVVLIMFDHQFGEKLMIGTPFFGAGELTFEMGEISVRQQGNVFFAILWAIAFYVLAALLYVATLGTFDWCMGRITIRRHRGASLGEVKRRRVPIRTSARPNHSHSQPLLRIHATDESNKNL